MACVKHCALNSMETARFRVDVRIDERAQHEVYLPRFGRVIDEGVAAVMAAYHWVHGQWCCDRPHRRGCHLELLAHPRGIRHESGRRSDGRWPLPAQQAR